MFEKIYKPRFLLQVSKSAFEDMRYRVALAIKELEDLENRSVLKMNKDKK